MDSDWVSDLETNDWYSKLFRFVWHTTLGCPNMRKASYLPLLPKQDFDPQDLTLEARKLYNLSKRFLNIFA